MVDESSKNHFVHPTSQFLFFVQNKLYNPQAVCATIRYMNNDTSESLKM